VEHFANYKNAQTFLNGDFDVQALAKPAATAVLPATPRIAQGRKAARHPHRQPAPGPLYREFKVSIRYDKARPNRLNGPPAASSDIPANQVVRLQSTDGSGHESPAAGSTLSGP
jgi:hypothetical protein